MSEASWSGDPDDMDDILPEEEACDYGLSEFCEHPFLRSTGCCFECPLYLEACEYESDYVDGFYDFALFWFHTELEASP